MRSTAEDESRRLLSEAETAAGAEAAEVGRGIIGVASAEEQRISAEAQTALDESLKAARTRFDGAVASIAERLAGQA